MKKLKLNLQQLHNVEVLTRSQLKNVLGGATTTTTGQCLTANAYCGTGANGNLPCCSGLQCVDAGNGKGTGQGEDKLCSAWGVVVA